MGRPATRKPDLIIAQAAQHPPGSLRAFVAPYLEALRLQDYSESTLRVRCYQVINFIEWCEEREIRVAADVSKADAQRYQRIVHQLRTPHGQPLSRSSVAHRIQAVRSYFAWLSKHHHILFSPAAELEMPRHRPRQLPKQVLTTEQVETVLSLTDVETALGVRDRAILETLYSTGVRRGELVRMKLEDVDAARGVVTVRHGKGRRQRMIPIGERALLWVSKYLREVRPHLGAPASEPALFLATAWGRLPGRALTDRALGVLVREYLDRAGLAHEGVCCHVFRHSMATLMLENGADVRYLQALLGHANLETTETYTHVAIGKLKQVHTATHPARLPEGMAEAIAGHTDVDDTRDVDVRSGAAAPAAPSAHRLPGYPSKRQIERAGSARPHKPYTWKRRQVRNAKTLPKAPSST